MKPLLILMKMLPGAAATEVAVRATRASTRKKAWRTSGPSTKRTGAEAARGGNTCFRPGVLLGLTKGTS
jgi:hypothetical protein